MCVELGKCLPLIQRGGRGSCCFNVAIKLYAANSQAYRDFKSILLWNLITHLFFWSPSRSLKVSKLWNANQNTSCANYMCRRPSCSTFYNWDQLINLSFYYHCDVFHEADILRFQQPTDGLEEVWWMRETVTLDLNILNIMLFEKK